MNYYHRVSILFDLQEVEDANLEKQIVKKDLGKKAEDDSKKEKKYFPTSFEDGRMAIIGC